ncbi:hypothetical protein ROHU_002068 [Labeo rohita]|uniref:Uncharacterized protein n=1 Tax=Labeo rohita TaxID=84645 RepID=A0A498NZT4_LABRO|nr:hypothetical protein ROHU_002068 [Labeo rohita]
MQHNRSQSAHLTWHGAKLRPYHGSLRRRREIAVVKSIKYRGQGEIGFSRRSCRLEWAVRPGCRGDETDLQKKEGEAFDICLPRKRASRPPVPPRPVPPTQNRRILNASRTAKTPSTEQRSIYGIGSSEPSGSSSGGMERVFSAPVGPRDCNQGLQASVRCKTPSFQLGYSICSKRVLEAEISSLLEKRAIR